MSSEKVCSCFGHKQVVITEELKSRVNEEIDKAVADGVRTFLFGGLSTFDEFVYDVVTEKKAQNPQLCVERVFCFPLENHLRKPPHWFDRREYESLCCPCKEFDGWFKSIYFRNLAMIDESDLVLFYAEVQKDSGAYKAYKYAVKKHKKLINFALE